LIPTLAELEEAERPLQTKSVNPISDKSSNNKISFSENTLKAWKIKFDDKYKKDHSLEEIQQLITDGKEYVKTWKEELADNKCRYGHCWKLNEEERTYYCTNCNDTYKLNTVMGVSQ